MKRYIIVLCTFEIFLNFWAHLINLNDITGCFFSICCKENMIFLVFLIIYHTGIDRDIFSFWIHVFRFFLSPQISQSLYQLDFLVWMLVLVSCLFGNLYRILKKDHGFSCGYIAVYFLFHFWITVS